MPAKSSDKTLAGLYTHSVHPWKYRTNAVLDHVIRTQHDAACRNITPLWFWRLDLEESGITSVFRETGHLKKRYQGPISSFMVFHQGTPGKPLTRTLVDNELPSTVKIDFAECIRLGEIFKVSDPGLPYRFYVPRASDVVQWNNSLFVIGDITADKFYAPVDRYVTWQGPVTLLRGDSTDPLRPLERQPENPTLEAPPWVQ